MDPRFRRNHQLHLLLKKRTYVSDHELYEMMRSKRVFRAQNELRRELERRLQEIKLDQKVKVASFMVQKATFIKMMAARDKGLRHLLNVKKHIGNEFGNDENIVKVTMKDYDEDANYHAFDDDRDFRPHNNHDRYMVQSDLFHTSDLQDGQNAYIIQSVNKEWMEDIMSKKNSNREKSKLKLKEKTSESTKSNFDNRMYREKERSEMSLQGHFHRNRTTSFRSVGGLDDKNPKQDTTKLMERPEKVKISTNMKKSKHDTSKSKSEKNTCNDDSSLKADTICPRDAVPHVEVPVTLPDIKIDAKECDYLKSDTITENPTSLASQSPLLFSNQRLLQPLPPIPTNKNRSSSLLDVPKDAPTPKFLQPHERERSVTMVFVEDSDDDDDDDYINQISSFDIEAFTKHHKRKRGYSIVISSTDLHQNDDEIEDEEIQKENKKKSKMTTKYPNHPSSWGVNVLTVSPRQRSNQWYQNFISSQKAKKYKNKTRHLPQDSNSSDDHPPNIGEDGGAWKPSIHSDSQHSPEFLCQLKLQKLKLHCQSLNQRVALFLSS